MNETKTQPNQNLWDTIFRGKVRAAIAYIKKKAIFQINNGTP